jgi:transcriptional regulator with XRE-family HTH domain
LTTSAFITARRRLGVSQADLTRRAGIRVETLNRIERAKMTLSVATMGKIDGGLTKLENEAHGGKRVKAPGDE